MLWRSSEGNSACHAPASGLSADLRLPSWSPYSSISLSSSSYPPSARVAANMHELVTRTRPLTAQIVSIQLDQENETFESFTDLVGRLSSRTDIEPPRKRRRLSPGRDGSANLSTLQEDGDVRFPYHVVLDKAVINIKMHPVSEHCPSWPEPFDDNTHLELTGPTREHAVEGNSLQIKLDCTGTPFTLAGTSETAEELHATLGRLNTWSKISRSDRVRHDSDGFPSRLVYTLASRPSDSRCARLTGWLLWQAGFSPTALSSRVWQLQSSLLEPLLPGIAHRTTRKSAWSLSDFYDNVHVPSSDQRIPSAIENVDLACALYSFQQRAVSWLLRREKVAFEGDQLVSVAAQEARAAPTPIKPVMDASGRQVYVNELENNVSTEAPRQSPDLYGGILCEEMGLGKTVELLALISLHRRDQTPHQTFELLIDPNLVRSKATLIISPPHILSQWQDEIARHAPNLKVLHYTGMQAESRAKHQIWSNPASLLDYDIVLTTYNVLSREIHYAEPPPDRNLRHAKKHQFRRSPLVQISWWRVCLDEAQMIEGGVSKAATVARLIPRINAFAVSGTPLKKDLDDLFGLIQFLWHEPYCLSKKAWSGMAKDLFARVVGNIAMRHTKNLVRQELRIPEQKRIVLTVPFTAIEEQNYSTLLQQMCEDCDLTMQGAPAVDDIDFRSPMLVEKMRSWLRRLRQTCLHPQVGDRNRRALGRKGPLKTVDEVLETMIEQNETALRAEQRQVVLAQVRCTHVLANDKSNTDRWPSALDAYKTALQKSTDFVDVIRKELSEEGKRSASDPVIRAISPEDESASESEGKQEQNVRLVALTKALRAALEVRHVCAFFVGTAYYQLKIDESRTPPESEEFQHLEKLEIEYYEQAKRMRKEMLHDWDESARRLMRKVDVARAKRLTDKVPSLRDYGGIESRKYLAKLDDLGDRLDRQAKYIETLRAKVIEYLLLDLVDQDDGKDTTGEEYEDSTKKQDELPVYVTILAAAVADRHQMLTGQVNFLVDHEAREAEKVAKRGEGLAPVLLLELLEKRREVLPKDQSLSTSASLRDIIGQIRSTITALQWGGGDNAESRAGRELTIVNEQLREAQQILSTQSKLVADMEKELDLFRSSMNHRNEFYRQLQIISDTVAPYKEDLDEILDQDALRKETSEREKAEQKLASLNTKRRFLMHLQTESNSDEARICVICQGTFELGVLTVCGHQYCKDCIRLWWKAHRTCPVCKRHLNLVDFHDITYKPSELRAQEEEANALLPSPSSSQDDAPKHTAQIYSTINMSTLKEIKEIDLNGSYGTKIDIIAKHILWIREHDPGAKSIIFSQFGEFLKVLRGAFHHFRIGHTMYTDSRGVESFKNDASVECLLLDAKSDSSGLNLINATHVFFCEPLINTAIELQAIARVHRIGQQRATTVYMYLISDTVEESIYELSVSRRMAHMSQNKGKQSRSGTATPKLEETALDAANSLELQQAPVTTLLVKGKSSGEVVQQDDLWQCLFGKSGARKEHVSDELDREVSRFLRAEAAEERRTVGASTS